MYHYYSGTFLLSNINMNKVNKSQCKRLEKALMKKYGVKTLDEAISFAKEMTHLEWCNMVLGSFKKLPTKEESIKAVNDFRKLYMS
jgi:hypothetical protein